MSKKDVIQDYLNYKRIGIKSIRKLSDLEYYIKEFLNSSKKEVKDFTEQELINHINKISKNYSISSLNGIKANLKNFIKWFFVDWSSRFRNLSHLCKHQKAPSRYQPEQMLTKEDIKKLVDGEKSIYWKSFFLILFYSGSRPCEICSLKWRQIDFEDDGAFIKIYSDKNKEYFDKFIPQDVVLYLKQLQTNNSEWVFPSVKENKIHVSVKGASARLINLSKRVFRKSINLYCLRHSVATILYNDYFIVDKNDVARQLGHNKNMEKKYSHLSKNQMRTRARKIWIRQPELTPEEKNHIKELEKDVEMLKGLGSVQEELIRNLLEIQNRVNFALLPEKEKAWAKAKLQKVNEMILR